MRKINLNKTELKKQRDQLKRFKRYLPTLYIKKQQLRRDLLNVRRQLSAVKSEWDELYNASSNWFGLLAGPFDSEQFIRLSEIVTEKTNIAGVSLERFKQALFEERDYDLFDTPLWVDHAVITLKKMMELEAQKLVLIDQENKIARELRVTAQRVNLFEKIKIPETEGLIKKINVYLGDQQTTAFGWSRLAKKKLAVRQQTC